MLTLVKKKPAAVRRTRAEWTEIIGDWRQSRLSVKTFCRRAGIKTKTFGWWRWAVEGRFEQLSPASSSRRGAALGNTVAGPRGTDRSMPVVSFVELIAPPSPPTERVPAESLRFDSSTGGAGVDVVVARGRVVRIAAGFHADTLRQVLAVLEEEKAC